ncbi:hypothetical protein SCALM49S_05063 [Streptomyces californicus]
MADTAQYVFGLVKQVPGKPVSERGVADARRRRGAYAALLLEWADAVPEDSYAAVVRMFVTSGVLQSLTVPEEMTAADNIALMVGTTWLHRLRSAEERWAAVVRSRKAGRTAAGLCLVCGKYRELLNTIPESIKSGAIPSSSRGRDAQLVSINSAAQGRGGAIQLVNTPVCEACGGRAMAAWSRRSPARWPTGGELPIGYRVVDAGAGGRLVRFSGRSHRCDGGEAAGVATRAS